MKRQCKTAVFCFYAESLQKYFSVESFFLIPCPEGCVLAGKGTTYFDDAVKGFGPRLQIVRELYTGGRRNSALTCYGRFFCRGKETEAREYRRKKMLRPNTDEYECKRPNTDSTDRDRVRDKIEGEIEIEILSLFPLGFIPIV